MQTSLIAGNPDRIKAKAISSQALEIEKVQRLDRKVVGSSDPKWEASFIKKDGDIVCSCIEICSWNKNSGLDLTNLTEHMGSLISRFSAIWLHE